MRRMRCLQFLMGGGSLRSAGDLQESQPRSANATQVLRRWAVLGLTLVALAWGDQQYMIDGDTFRHQGLGLSFRIPSGWGPEPVRLNDGGAIFRLVAPTGRTSIVLIITPHKNSGADVEDPADGKTTEQIEKEVATVIRGFHFTRVATLKVGPHRLDQLSATASGGARIHRIAVIPDGPKLCILWMQSNKDTFDNYLPSFDGVLRSFEWDPPAIIQGES